MWRGLLTYEATSKMHDVGSSPDQAQPAKIRSIEISGIGARKNLYNASRYVK